jgi:hypothetical protein
MSSSKDSSKCDTDLIDLTVECQLGHVFSRDIDDENPLDFEDVCDSLQSGVSDFVFWASVTVQVICRVVRIVPDEGAVCIVTSENPDKPTRWIYPDLIGPVKLFHYNGFIKSYSDFKFRGIDLGMYLPWDLVGSVVFFLPRNQDNGFTARPVALKQSRGVFVLAVLVDLDESDEETPLVVRRSADYDTKCTKMALNSMVYWMLRYKST